MDSSRHKTSPPLSGKCTMKVSPSPRYDLTFLAELQGRHRFSAAVCKQNEVATTAIQSLDCLNDQIVQYILTSQCSPSKDDVSLSKDTAHSSMVLIRRLLLDAQSRFRKMVDDNKRLASHIDSSIQAANQEVSVLRAELASTNSRLSQINLAENMGKKDASTQIENDLLPDPKQEKIDADKEDMEMAVQTLSSANEQLIEDYKHLIDEHDVLKCNHEAMKNENESFKAETSRLENQLKTLRKELDELRQVKVEGATIERKPSYGELKLELIQTRQELNRAKEVLQGMKSDRKRLKGEKLDLLSQMKQLYTTLEEKETELRDFIRNYEQRVKESDDMIKQLAKEKENLERDKWDIITRARDAAERAMFLKAQLDSKEIHIQELEEKLTEATEKMSSQEDHVTSTTPTPEVEESEAGMDDSIIIDEENGFSTTEESSVLNCSFVTPQGNAQVVSHSTPNNMDDFTEAKGPLFKWFTQSSDFDITSLDAKPGKKKKKGLGSLSRVFSRGRMRRSIAAPHAECLLAEESSTKLCVLSQENYQEKLGTIEHMVGVHMQDWRAHHVLAWLEITLAMPMYAYNCLRNVKSGRVLLGLSDSELSSALGVSNTMHRRKLRLAIEQHRNPNDIKYPKANEIDPTWVAHRFLPDLGLPQYTDMFEEQLCDGPVLDTLTRRDLEKHFNIHRKFHQASILHAIELLRRIEFNKEKLYHRRNASEERDSDLIVWTNDRLIKWTRSIDLGEYCENLMESGLHGALMVLEPSFSAGTLSSALGIPPSKSYIRRHLTTELDAILKPARVALDPNDSKDRSGDNGAPSKHFTRGRKGSQDEGRSRLSFKGSLGRAFGKKVKEDLKLAFESEPPKKKISAPIPIQHSSLSSLDTDSQLMKKGFNLSPSLKDPMSSDMHQSSYRPIIASVVSETETPSKSSKRKALAYSDQTLYKSALSELISRSESQSPPVMAKTAANNFGYDHSSGNPDLDPKRDEKISITSSQETLTEQSVHSEKNNNNKNDSVISSVPTQQKQVQLSSKSVSNERKGAIKMEQPSVAFDKALVASKLPSKHSGECEQLNKSSSLDRSSPRDQKAGESIDDDITRRDSGGKKMRASLKETFPQTTSV